MFKISLKKHFKYFKYFYSYLKLKFVFALLISIVVGFLDGLGLAMFLPLLQTMDGGTLTSSEGLGNLNVFIDFVESFGVEFNFNVILLLILILFSLKAIFYLIDGLFNLHVLQLFMVKLRMESINLFSSYSYGKFVKADSGRIQNTLSTEVNRVASSFKLYCVTLQYSLFVLVYVTLAFLSNANFVLLLLVGAIITGLAFKLIYKNTKKHSSSLTNENHVFQGLLIQSVSFFKYLKSTGRFLDFGEKLKKSIKKIEADNLKIGKVQTIIIALREPIVLFIVVAVIYVQVNIFEQSLSLILISLLLFYRALNYLMVLQAQWNSFLGLSGSLTNVADFVKELKEGKETTSGTLFTKLNLGIELEDVKFSYNNDDYIINNLNLKINKNTTVAFVGESGSGKTTVVNILAGLLKTTGGRFSIDGMDSTGLNINSYQNRIGYITQEAVIFDDTIYNNITFWAEKTPENIERFWKALSQASISDFVELLPLKEDAPLGNNGIMVSGGQKQRLSIARELYKEIDILIMDEATSALDSETERSIQENIEKLKGNYTIIIVAHRLSTIKTADNIVLMSKGNIEDNGDFKSLIEKNDRFRRIVDLQEL